MRPEWPGDGANRGPQPQREPWPGNRASGAHELPPHLWPGNRVSGAPEPPSHLWPGNRVSGAPEPAWDQRSGYEPQHQERGVPRINPVAIASLLCGIALVPDLLGSLGSILVAVPAFICGGIALWQINTRRERGQWIAIAGLGLGLLGILFVVMVQG